MRTAFLFFSLFFVAFSIAEAAGQSEDKQSEHLSLHDVIINSEVIAIGDIQFVGADLSGKCDSLKELLNFEILYGHDIKSEVAKKLGAKDEPALGRALLISEPRQRLLSSPVLRSNSRSLIFFGGAHQDINLSNFYHLDKACSYYSAINTWQSVINLDFNRKTLSREILSKKYKINDPIQLIAIVKDLCKWRQLTTTSEQISNLLLLLHAHSTEQLYKENIPPMIGSILYPNAKSVAAIEGRTHFEDEIGPNLNEYIDLNDLANGLLTLLNNHPTESSYTESIPIGLEKFGLKLEKTEGLYHFKVQIENGKPK